MPSSYFRVLISLIVLGISSTAVDAQVNRTLTPKVAPPAPLAQPKLETAAPQVSAPTLKEALKSPLFQRKLNSGDTKLRGFIELHNHPMSYLGFGGKLIFGAPDVDLIMPPGSLYYPKGAGVSGATCNNSPKRAASVSEALGSCYSAHGGWDALKNKCGNSLRRIVLDSFESGQHANNAHDVDHPEGYPNFTRWPKYNDVTHQQMWVDWIKRAYQGGLRVMVALALNSYTLATGISGDPPLDDKTSGDLQIDELKRMVEKHGDWMKIAYSPADLRDIVGKQDKLAVIVGLELDDIGNFAKNRVDPSAAAVRAEIRRLYAKGVRYAFPVHVIDNAFGGAAIYEYEFNRANCFHFGSWWQLGCSAKGDGIEKLAPSGGWDLFKSVKLGGCGGDWSVPVCPHGHVNTRGLQVAGKAAIEEMMRLGMLIDIDHGSAKTVKNIIDNTKYVDYPLVSGHNGLRGASGPGHENQRTKAEYKEIARRGGIAGVGWGNADTEKWLKNARAVQNLGIKIGLGSDINGLVQMPAPRAACKSRSCVVYSDAFPQARFGNKTWNYNTEGVANFGLFPDALRDVESQGGLDVVNQLFDGAEAFASMWEKAAVASKKVKPAPADSRGESLALGKACTDHLQCASARCDNRSGAGCVAQDGTGASGEFCTTHQQCQSQLCNIAQGKISGTCSATGKSLGQSCAAHQECLSQRCDNRPTAGCVLQDGAGATGEFCATHQQCQSGYCIIAIGKISGKCSATGNWPFGQACTSHLQCLSQRCDNRPGAGCVAQDGAAAGGDFCTTHQQCHSGNCVISSGKISGKCSATGRALGQPCLTHAECLSQRCDNRPGAGCVAQDSYANSGEFCTTHQQCKSGKCVIASGKISGVCSANERALGQSCVSHGECASQRCDNRSGAGCVAQDGQGANGDFCTTHQQCHSGYCNVTSGKISGKCSTGSKSLGQACTSHAECKSMRCDNRPRAGCVAQDGYAGSNEFCTTHQQCQSGFCTVAAGQISGTCRATARALGQSCVTHAECLSQRCDNRPGAGCVAQDGQGETGAFCTTHQQCRGQLCIIAGGRISGICSPR